MGKKSYNQRIKNQAVFRKFVEKQGLNRIEIQGANSKFSRSRYVSQKVRLPTKTTTEKYQQYLKRSEAAKKGWITRRINQQKKNEEIALKIFQPEDMVRNVWGTACSDKQVPFSFTFFVFSKENLEGIDFSKCENKFSDQIDYWLRQHYPNKGYNYNTAESVGWFTSMVRREENLSVSFFRDDFEKWIFEINGSEENRGDLDEIL